MRFSFRAKLAWLTATFSAVPLIGVALFLIDVNEREVESSRQALHLALTGEVANALDARLERTERLLHAVSGALTDESLEGDARVALAMRLLDADEALDAIAVYDADGALIDRMFDPDAPHGDTPDALPRGDTHAQEGDAARVHAPSYAVDGAPRVLVSVPIVADGRRTGYLAAPLALVEVQRLVAELSTSQLASHEGTVAVLDQDGRHLAHPDRDAIGRLATAARAPSRGASGSAEVSDAEGRRWITTQTAVGAAPWSVLTRVPRDVVYASIDRMQTVVAGVVALTLLGALLAAFFFARRLAAPIGRLVAFTRKLAAREFDADLVVGTSDELAVLGDALVDAARELGASEARIREEQAIRADLGRYLPAELVEQIILREQSMELGGQRRAITVLFADVVAFTPLSDRLPPEQVVALLNELFTLLTEAVFRNGGTVDKFVGDCVMALFGAPAPHVDHAARALCAAQDMMRFLESANAGWRDTLGVEVQLAIGINSGEAVVGNVGSRERMEYTAIGDVVNVAARLETIARPAQILVTRATATALSDRGGAGGDGADGGAARETDAFEDHGFELVEIGEREVPGRAAPVELLEVRW